MALKPNIQIRLRDVRAQTGWSKEFIRKLVANGLLTRYYPYSGARAWYQQAEVTAILNQNGKPK